jgi:hypothetical protein
MSKKIKEKKDKNENKIITIRLRINRYEHMRLTARAGTFFDGNLSKFIRYAIANYKVPSGYKKES